MDHQFSVLAAEAQKNGTCARISCDKPRVGKSKYCREDRDLAHREYVENIRAREDEKARRFEHFRIVYGLACEAGATAGAAAAPTPMVVEQHTDVADDSSPVKERWVVPDGPCGFAWVSIRPGTSSFAKWLVKYGHAKRDSYAGGVMIWISEFNQSMQRKEACAQAMAKVLREGVTGIPGIEGISAYANSRMD